MASRKNRDQLKASRQSSGGPPPSITNLMDSMVGGAPPVQAQNAIVLDGRIYRFRDCELSDAGLHVPDSTTAADFAELRDILFSLEGRIQLLIGDMLVASERLQYGDISEIADAYGRSPGTLYKWKSVCQAVTIFLRRKVLAAVPDAKPLSISHYELVMTMDEDAQAYWLIQAAEHGWSVAALRDAIRAANPPPALQDGQQVTGDSGLFAPARMPRLKRIQQDWASARGGDAQARKRLMESLDATQTWLDQVRQSLDD